MDHVEEELGEDRGDDLEVLSQYTDEGSRDDEKWSDSLYLAKGLYTVDEINRFLDETKGKVGVEVGAFFPDLEKLVASVAWVRKNSSYKEISQQKCFRLKKAHNCNKAKGQQIKADNEEEINKKITMACIFFLPFIYIFSSLFLSLVYFHDGLKSRIS